MRVLRVSEGVSRMVARVRPGWGRDVCRLCMVAAVVVSFVWEESMRAVRVWKRLS